jgi:hypothetical protein
MDGIFVVKTLYKKPQSKRKILIGGLVDERFSRYFIGFPWERAAKSRLVPVFVTDEGARARRWRVESRGVPVFLSFAIVALNNQFIPSVRFS